MGSGCAGYQPSMGMEGCSSRAAGRESPPCLPKLGFFVVIGRGERGAALGGEGAGTLKRVMLPTGGGGQMV